MGIEKAYMVPHPPLIIKEVGKGSEKQVMKTIESYEKVAKEISEIKPETIIITSPHTRLLSDAFHISAGFEGKGSFERFNAPEVKFKESYDNELVKRIIEIAANKKILIESIKDKEPELDHGTMVPLYFIRKYLKDFKIIIVGLSELSLIKHYELGQIINEAVNLLNRKVVFVASGDLSHKLQEYGPYGYSKEGEEYDKRIMKTCRNADFLELFDYKYEFCKKAAECGHRSFTIMAGALDGKDIEAEELSHEDVTGVGYGICTFEIKENNENRKFKEIYLNNLKNKINNKNNDEYINLARNSIKNYILYNRKIEVPKNISDELINKKGGVFVSIHEHDRLRGCIGTIYPTTTNIAEEIINNAISAATKDYRFEPISKEELDYLEINVDILGEKEIINSLDELDIKKYGIIVTSGYKRGLLLPDIEGINSIDEQIKIARKKGNIEDNEEITIERFEVIRHK